MEEYVAQIESFNLIWWLVGLFLIVSVFVTVATVVCKFFDIIGKPIGVWKQIKKDHELTVQNTQTIQELSKKHEEDTKQSILHDKMIRDDLKQLTETVNSISVRLDAMQSKNDATELAKLKEKILAYYRKYKDIGEWERFEADVFWGLFDSYIAHGGNSFVKHDIEPVMRNLKIID